MTFDEQVLERAMVCVALIQMAEAIARRSMPKHITQGIELEDVTKEDRALVADFYANACHAEWCEYDALMLEYVAARSRMNGQVAADVECVAVTARMRAEINKLRAEAQEPNASGFDVSAAAEAVVAGWEKSGNYMFSTEKARTAMVAAITARLWGIAPATLGGLLAQQVADEAKEKLDDVYAERDMCVSLIARMGIALGLNVGIGQHPREDMDWDPAWRNIVFVDLPAGQVSWHIRESEVPWFAGVTGYTGFWDTHTTSEKYRRVLAPLLVPATAPMRLLQAVNKTLTWAGDQAPYKAMRVARFHWYEDLQRAHAAALGLE